MLGRHNTTVPYIQSGEWQGTSSLAIVWNPKKHLTPPRMKQREVEFAVGDWIFFKIRPYRQASPPKKCSEKLALKFFEPYFIEYKIGPVAYKLQLPLGTTIHQVFHDSQMRRLWEQNHQVQPKLLV